MTHLFEIDRLAIALGNGDHHGRYALAQAEVRIGAFQVTAYLDPHGAVSLPHSLRDDALAAQVSAEMRRLTLVELQRRWGAATVKEGARLLERRQP